MIDKAKCLINNFKAVASARLPFQSQVTSGLCTSWHQSIRIKLNCAACSPLHLQGGPADDLSIRRSLACSCRPIDRWMLFRKKRRLRSRPKISRQRDTLFGDQLVGSGLTFRVSVSGSARCTLPTTEGDPNRRWKYPTPMEM